MSRRIKQKNDQLRDVLEHNRQLLEKIDDLTRALDAAKKTITSFHLDEIVAAVPEAHSSALPDCWHRWEDLNILSLPVRERLKKAIIHLYKYKRLNRADVERLGEVSTPQASIDIAAIRDFYPGLMSYDKSLKCYVLNEDFVLEQPADR